MLKNESWREKAKRWRQAPSRALAASFDSCHDCLGLVSFRETAWPEHHAKSRVSSLCGLSRPPDDLSP